MRPLSWLALASTLVLAPTTMLADAPAVRTVGFDQLAGFVYDPPASAEAPRSPVPEEVQRLSGARVAVSGFLVPLRLEAGRVRQAVLVRDLMSCCYGTIPRFNEFVIVTTTEAGLPPHLDAPVTLTGTLTVGEQYEQGFFVGLYALHAERLDAF